MQDETKPKTVQENQQLVRDLNQEFTYSEPHGFQATKQQYLAGNIGGRNFPQQMGYNNWQGPQPQDQQKEESSQRTHSFLAHFLPLQEHYLHHQVKYDQQQSYPPGHGQYTGPLLGTPGNFQFVQQPPVYQPSTVPQVEQQQHSLTTTSSSQSFEAQIDQQIHNHQQRLYELQQLQQQQLLTLQYDLLTQTQQKVQQEKKNLDQLLTFKRQLQLPPQPEQQQQSGSLSYHPQMQSEQPSAQQQHYHEQFDNRQTVSEQPGQKFSYQPTVLAANQPLSHTPHVLPYQLMNTNTQQTSIHGKHQGTTYGVAHQDVMYEVRQGTPQETQWGKPQLTEATTQLTQEEISSVRQHMVPSETLGQDFQAQMEHELTIQDHQATTDANMDSSMLISYQPTDQVQHHQPVVFSHKEHTVKDELKVLVEEHEVVEQLEGQSATVLSQNEALQAQAKQLTKEDLSQEESQQDFMQSPISCQQDKEWSVLICKLFALCCMHSNYHSLQIFLSNIKHIIHFLTLYLIALKVRNGIPSRAIACLPPISVPSSDY